MKCAKDQSTFCRSYVFMEKFKPAQNKKFTEAASDMWTLRVTAKLLNISSITGTFQVFCLHIKNISLKWYTVRKMNKLSWVQRIIRSSSCGCVILPHPSHWEDSFDTTPPLHPVHIAVHFNLYVIQVYQVVHSILQPHLIIFRSSCGVGGFVICTGRHIQFNIFHPHCSGGKSFPHQLWTVS